MRMIRYRAKVKLPERPINRKYEVPEGQWVYGEPHTIDCPIPHIHTANGDVGKQPIDKETLGQFTGLIDKNGKEVYEGDIVKIKTLQGIVTWHPNGYFCIHTYKCDISEVSYTAIGDMVDYLHKDLYDDGLEVIGNIHDNPELLKGGLA